MIVIARAIVAASLGLIARGDLIEVEDSRTGVYASPDVESESMAGLIATFSPSLTGRSAVRIDPDAQFNWADASPDPRVPADRFVVRWQGKLLVQSGARYRFHLFVAGTCRLAIDGKQAIAGATNESGWLSSGELPLEAGHHAIDLNFSKTTKQARIGLYWESNKFALEPIGPRWLSHEKANDWEPGDFERGEELVRARRCAACHMIPGIEMERKAPSLDQLADRVHPSWLVRWLQNPHDIWPDARMPATNLSRDDARAVASFLFSASKKAGSSAKATSTKGRPDAGASLVRSIGCLACHTLDGTGISGRYGGGPLDRIAEKRPAGFFREWLKKPESLNAAHRMPVFSLTNDEIEDLTSFLSTRGEPRDDAEAAATPTKGKEEINRGQQLVVDHSCAACHDIPEIEKPDRTAARLRGTRPGDRRIDWDRSCLGQGDPTRHQPGFEFDEKDRRAIRGFIDQLPATVAPQSQYELGRRLLRELNCASCHPRDLDHGLQPSILSRGGDGAETELAKLRGELEPPSLTSVGDKFHDDTLAKLIQGGQSPRRPWLKVRMPRFNHTDTERDAVVHFLVEHDRIPANPPTGLGRSGVAGVESSSPQPKATTKTAGGSKTRPQPPGAELEPASALAAGHQLVSARGFGCMSCHTVGKHHPKSIAVNARGSDLLKIGDRVRHEWFLRWTRDPARIVPGMEMPSITVPVRGILEDQLDLQIESLWQALNSPSFVVPSDRDTAQQIISLKPGDEAVILRDVMYDCPPGSGWCPRAFAIGLPNRHNILFDLDVMSLRAWWFGDFAQERTEGKSWLWAAGGLPVWRHATKVPVLALRHVETGNLLIPKQPGLAGQMESWMRGRAHGSDDPVAMLWYRVVFEGGLELKVRDWIFNRADQRGFDREIAVYKLPKNYVPVLLAVGDSKQNDRKELIADGPLGLSKVRELADGDGWSETRTPLGGDDSKRSFALAFRVLDERSRHYITNLEYLVNGLDVSAGRTLAAESPVVPPTRQAALPVLPGFEVVRAQLAPSVMPSALTFRPDSSLVVCSLKGGVFHVRDSDGDGLEDAWFQLSDHLSAPFGVLADGNDLIVSHKPELLRLNSVGPEFEGRVSFADVLATGWGYTEDYHDWTFGPVRDSDGNLVIATASDYAHKGRPKEARKWRGRLLRVLPDGQIEELARGARYPTGLAANREGQIFFTDNQGVQNTFNEINHLVPGSRYGVPAQDDPPPDKDPWPEREPAIKIPHPWTRSVNGICFLESGGKWGPFEGHGIGCEYDTRGLIRFSLQKIGDTYQGACYPFTLPEDQVPPDQRLLGPICCAVSPNGDLYVGGLRDSGWGGGNNVGELVRIKPSQNVPLGIREVRAWRGGFVIEFTGPIDQSAAADAANYEVASYRRIWKGTYATPDSDRRTEQITKIEIAKDSRSAILTLDSMRTGFVYDIHLKAIGRGGNALWPAEAYYTLNQVPD